MHKHEEVEKEEVWEKRGLPVVLYERIGESNAVDRYQERDEKVRT